MPERKKTVKTRKEQKGKEPKSTPEPGKPQELASEGKTKGSFLEGLEEVGENITEKAEELKLEKIGDTISEKVDVSHLEQVGEDLADSLDRFFSGKKKKKK